MATKLEKFLEEKKIDQRRLLSVSKRLERLRPEDRAARWKKKHGKSDNAAETAGAEESEQAAEKPRRSGRPVTEILLRRVAGGKKISGPSKTRILRAVNHILTAKKQDAVELRTLF